MMIIEEVNQELKAEIELFKAEAMKTHVVECWANSYTNSDPFAYAVGKENEIFWMKTQAHQLWQFWLASKTQTKHKDTISLHLVWNKNQNECVGFLDKKDARFASTGNSYSISYSTLADNFRETYEYEAENQDFLITTVQIERGENQ